VNASIRSSPIKGLIETLYTSPPENSAVIGIDEMCRVATKGYPRQQLARTEPPAEPQQPAQRAKQNIEYGQSDEGYVFGAFRPATEEALTKTYEACHRYS